MRTSQGARLVPVGDPLDDAWADVFPSVVGVGVGAIEHPFLDVDEIAAIQRERREKAARRKPCGFTADWNDQPRLRSVA